MALQEPGEAELQGPKDGAGLSSAYLAAGGAQAEELERCKAVQRAESPEDSPSWRGAGQPS